MAARRRILHQHGADASNRRSGAAGGACNQGASARRWTSSNKSRCRTTAPSGSWKTSSSRRTWPPSPTKPTSGRGKSPPMKWRAYLSAMANCVTKSRATCWTRWPRPGTEIQMGALDKKTDYRDRRQQRLRRGHRHRLLRGGRQCQPGGAAASDAAGEQSRKPRAKPGAAKRWSARPMSAMTSRYMQLWNRHARPLVAIDVLVNNAGYNVTERSIADTSAEQWRDLLAVNLTSAFIFTKAVLPEMKARGDGLIINLASRAAMVPQPAGRRRLQHIEDRHGSPEYCHQRGRQPARRTRLPLQSGRGQYPNHGAAAGCAQRGAESEA